MMTSRTRGASATQLESTLVGVAGEYFVAAELSRRGYLAAITLRNSRGVDIIASDPEASRSVSIQVKTNQRSRPRWVLGKKADSSGSSNHFYVFVILGDVSERPTFYVVPSEVVANQCASSHRAWLKRKRADDTFRKDSDVRVFVDADGTYLEAWERLGL